jgi:hypothetical protein
MVTVPELPTPLTIPVAEPTAATAVLLLLQVPPVEVVLSDDVWPEHMTVVPVIGAGGVTTVTVVTAGQLPVGRKVIMAVPALIPCTVPVVAVGMVATAVLLLLHVPVPQEVSVEVPPTHAVVVPTIATVAVPTVSALVL